MNQALHRAARILMVAIVAMSLQAQTQTPVTYIDDFQSYGKSKKPKGWIDGKVGDLKAKPRGYFKTAADPLQDKKGTNIVFGTTKSTGTDDDEEKKLLRIGYFATYVDKTFSAAGRFEVQGRLVELSSIGRFGLVVLSGYPDKDNYYLIGEKKNAQGKVTLQLTAFGAGTPTGTIDSNLLIPRSKWYRFRISVDDAGGATAIRARFWLDGTTEPATYQIDARDASAQRLKTGHFGLWSGGRGDEDHEFNGQEEADNEDGTKGFYIDDVNAHSPSDTTPPVVTFYESGTKLDPATTPAFNRDAKIEIRVTDDLSTFTSTALLDGNPYTSLTPVTAEGTHNLTVHAVDAPGNVRDAALKFIIDKTKPAVALLANGSPLVSGTIFDKDVTLSATIQDASPVTTTATFDNAVVMLPLPVAQEQNHQISVTATDVANNSATASGSFTIDKSAPVIAIQANGKDLAAGASFRANVTLSWTVTDLTLNTVSAKLDNSDIQSGFTITTEGQHTLVITATDKVNHSTTETRSFFLSKSAPEVTLLANGSAFVKDKTYNSAVTFTVTVKDATPTTTVVTVDGATYTQGTPVTGDGPHTVQVVVTNAGSFTTTVGPFGFVIDTVKPTITMTESGQPFPDGAKFTRDVLPIVTATDALTASPTIVVTLDGKTYPTNTAVTEESADHVISATATDAGDNSATVGPFHFVLDKTKPVVTVVNAATGKAFPPDALFNVPVSVKVAVIDVTKTTVVATLDGASFNLGSGVTQPDGSILYTPAPIASEGTHTLSVVATDGVGFSNDPVSSIFVIDTTPPHITFTDPTPNSTVTAISVVVAGTFDDAQSITINGRAAGVNAASKTFTIAGVELLEGRNEIAAVAVDAAGNQSTTTLVVNLDTRSPEISITTPAANACVDTTSLQVGGKAADLHLDSVKVTVGSATPVAATIDSATGAWTAVIPVAEEGGKLITVEATDTSGHSASASRAVVIDRTAPVLDLRENGSPFATGAVVNRKVSIFIRAIDADASTVLAATLDGAAYASGTPVGAEGRHTLSVSATDCAGHRTDKSIEFTLDFTPPGIRNLNPGNGSTAGSLPSSISGATDTDAVRVAISGTPLVATPAADGSFAIPSVPFVEGVNRFTLVATDRAGNSATVEYAVTVKTTAPTVEIRESGLPIAAATLFNRTVTPLIRSNDSSAAISATLNGAPFTSGTTISNDGDYKIVATATDTLNHSSTAEATFSIDRTAPVVTITAPAAGTVQTDHVAVRGTAGDAISASVNGQPVTLGTDGSFVLDPLLLEIGTNAIVATGRDRAGNAGRAEVVVIRDDVGSGLLITYPTDRSLTNRPTTDVLGRILSPGRASSVMIGSTATPVDPTGAFRVSGYALVEGENTITATVTAANGFAASALTRVTADFTPPSLTILESGQPLRDGARFSTQAVLTIQSADTGGGAVTTTLTVDGTLATTLPLTITTAGGHSVVATASDLAGNQVRVERTLFVGQSTGTVDCKLDSFDPANGSVILANKTTLVGRSGGAVGVKVNGVAAIVADGAFCATVELSSEGANTVTIACTDGGGNPTGTPATITLQRVTGDPSIAIDTPIEGFVSAQETIAVSGTVGPGVVSNDVNGIAATISGSDTNVSRPFTVASVRLAGGLNIVVAHGKNAAGRIATASRRGTYLKTAPAISISAPQSNSTTGITKTAVSGTYTNLDPTTIVVTNLVTGVQTQPQTTRASDTTGSFAAADVPLVAGEQMLKVAGRDRLNREASGTVVVKLFSGAPGIAIAQPADHASYGGGSDSVAVSGTFQAAPGSTVDINGVAATVNGSAFTGSAKFSTLAGGITPIVARVTEPGGASASAIVVVTQIGDAPKVVESFPAPNAVEVDSSALLLVLFSQPMDGATLNAGAFRLEDANGTPVSGTLYLDKDVLTFAPAALLGMGGRYTIRVTTTAKNLAGSALSAEYSSTFTAGSSAPSSAPTVTPLGSAVCGQSITVNGTAAPNARVQLQSGSLILDAAANATGAFKFTYPISGQSGFVLIRVRVVGSDGSFSPAAELKVRVDCNGPQVLNAAFDRAVNKLTIQFSEPINAATATVGGGNAILLTLDDGRVIGGTATVSPQSTATVTPAEDLSAKTFALTVSTAIKDLVGNPMIATFSQSFPLGGDQPVAGNGSGFISGEVYDATTGRPLASASVTIDVPSPGPIATSTDARGRYVARTPEGAHTIKAALAGYTSVWRQIIVPAGAGVIPVDIRLTRRGDPKTSDGSAIALTHGGDTTITRRIDLAVPAGSLASGRKIALTSAGAQALTGLLPLGWSPIGAGEIVVDGSDTPVGLAGAQLTFSVPNAEITAATQNLTAVQYNSVRDEWGVLVGVVNVGSDGKVIVPIASSGAYALVYPDKGAGLTTPALPVAGDVLRGVPAAAAGAPALIKRDFKLDPAVILPTGRTVATLRIEGSGVSFPSGTAVQAYIDEDLKLADGSRLLDPPFATDLLLYRTLIGDLGVADFHLAPSPKAAQVILEIGFDHIRVFPYPGRLDRGTLIGSEGGRVPADDKVAVEIASGAVAEPMRATATSLAKSDLDAIGAIAGFRIVGGFQFGLQRATQPPPQDLDNDGRPDAVPPVELFIPARATFTVDRAQLPAGNTQVVLGELLDQTPYGRLVRLAAPMMPVDASQTSTAAVRFTTKAIDRSILPVDGVAHEGRYVLLAAESPIAFATGTVHLLSATGRLTADARVLAPPLGVSELSRVNGIYNIPVPARPAGPFTLIPRHTSTGDGVAYAHAAAVDPDSVNRVDLGIVPQPPKLGAVVVLKGDPPSQATLSSGAVTTDVSLTTNIRATFTPSIDPASVTATSITVTHQTTGAAANGAAAADGTVGVVWTLTAGERLKPNSRYTVVVSSTIRGANGTAVGSSATYTFATVKQLLNAEVHRERIRITIPDANKLSRIVGDPGALPAGWQAVAIRRGVDFAIRYQATAANDGSFSFTVGNGGDAADLIDMGNLIDLQVVNTTGNVAAVFALTPFVSEDGHGFVAPAGAAVRFTTPENLTLDVPAGAFDVPTIINVTVAKKEEFLDIYRLEEENEYAASAHVDFDGVAKKPLQLEAPVPPGFDTTGKQFILAQKGMSMDGPRLAVIDLVKVANGKFIAAHDEVSVANLRVIALGRNPVAQQTLTGSRFSKYLTSLIRGGMYMYLDIKQPVGGAVGWAAMEGLQAGYDLTYDLFWSYFVPHIAVYERGGALLPIVTGKPFTITGTDPGTGLQAFKRTYDPITFGDPGTVVPIPSAQQNDGGPYPVFAGPFRAEMVDLDVEQIDIRSVRNFNLRLDGGSVAVTPGSPPLDADRKVELLNVSNGTFTSGTAGQELRLAAKTGQRVVLLIEERGVDATAPISIAFNEPIFVGTSADADAVDTVLHGLLKVEQAPEPVANAMPSFNDITPQVRFTADSGNRRINVLLPTVMQSEAVYRVTLQPDIADVVSGAAGLKLGQGTVDNAGVLTPVGGGNAFHLSFHVRKPAGALASFTAASTGLIHGMDLAGNVLFVSAMDGGLLSYDVSNPTGPPVPLGSIPGPPQSIAGHLAVTVDRHNRVYATAQSSMAGMFRSYRVEDFVAGGTNIPIKGTGLINWKIGLSQNMGLPSNTMLSDRPESIPFRIKVLLQDDEKTYNNRKEFIAGAAAQLGADYPDRDLQSFTANFNKDDANYRIQRITVENLSLDMKWSADATDTPAVISNIIARSTDKMRVIRNHKTFVVVAHLGYGIGIYDANAFESNRYAGLFATTPGHIKEQLILTAGKISRDCLNATPDYGIIENYLNSDAELRGDENTGNLYSYAPDPYRGLLDLKLTLPSGGGDGTREDSCEQRSSPNTGGLLFRSVPAGNEVPRIKALHDAIVGAAGREPFNHFTQVAPFHWSISIPENAKGLRGTEPKTAVERDYLLVGGAEYGLIVVETFSKPAQISPYPLDNSSVADVIWIPGGANGVRVYQQAHIAVVTDRYGRVLLVDLSRIDERWDENGKETSGLFPTAAKALSTRAGNAFGVGADDPRIIWKSEPGVVSGTLAPVFDPSTGLVFAGGAGRQVKILSAVDPRVNVKVNLGEEGGLSDVGGIVPLGIAPPKDIQDRINALPSCDGSTLRCKENASLGAFRLEVSLPGNMVDALTQSNNELQLAVESERVAGAITEQTPDGFPRAHLRRYRRDGSAETPNRVAGKFKMIRIVPDDLKGALRNQRGYNRFISPWIVAIADPRASSKYDWNGASPQQKKEAGCGSCDRPKHLEGKTENDGIYELLTNGRFVAVRPELASSGKTIFDATTYSYLGSDNRLLGRFSTIMADTVRPTDALSAAQNPPTADGLIQEETLLQSGEVESRVVDLIAGGRADFNVTFDRTYRSRTIGASFMGQGWDSSMFQRLRALPNGDVEFRDSDGETWRFRGNVTAGGYDSPKGLFLKLARTQRGWTITDQKWRITEFDDLGRMLSRSDEFFDPQTPGSGNVIRYAYDETGRLNQIVDPVQRVSRLSYWSESEAGVDGAYPGLLKRIVDWRDRKIEFVYDGSAATLTRVKLPDAPNSAGVRPTVQYTYMAGEASYNDQLELRSNLQSIVDPQQAASGGGPRVQFSYEKAAGFKRDRVLTQQWGTGETVAFAYDSPTDVQTSDALGQKRKYKLTEQPKDYWNDRAHVLSLVESGVPISAMAFGQLAAPSTVTASSSGGGRVRTLGVPQTSEVDRTFSFEYDSEGLVRTSMLNGVRSRTASYKNVQPSAPGFVLESLTTTPLAGPAQPITQTVEYQTGANASTFQLGLRANDKRIESPEPHRGKRTVQASNNSVLSIAEYGVDGLLNRVTSSGGTDSSGPGASTSFAYAPATAAVNERGLLRQADSGGGIQTAFVYRNVDLSEETDARGVVLTTEYDPWRRPLHLTAAGPDLTYDERFSYDATGNLVKQVSKQGEADVTTTYRIDVMGRRTGITQNDVAGTGSAVSNTVYDLKSRTVTVDQPGTSRTTIRLDGLGRPISSETTTGGDPITEYFAYDLAGNLVVKTDLQTAEAWAYDAHGRLTGAVNSDGTRVIADLDAMSNPLRIVRTDAAGATVAESSLSYTDGGKLRSASTKLSGTTRTSDFVWDGAGRNTGMSIAGRAVRAQYDAAGRVIALIRGGGTAQSVANAFERNALSSHSGFLPQKVSHTDRSGTAYDLALQFNTAAAASMAQIGDLEWKRQTDQAGNAISSSQPGRPARIAEYDSRGAIKSETLPGGGTNAYEYDGAGSLRGYKDPVNEITRTDTDLIGRPTKRTYADGTSETIIWEGRRVKSIADRAARLQSFVYDTRGRIEEIHGASDVLLDKITYDTAGRITSWTNQSSTLEFGDYDADGNAHTTKQKRLNGTAIVDQYSQTHTFDVHGDRIGWTMPSYTSLSGPWTASLKLAYDDAGNLTNIDRQTFGASGTTALIDARYRGPQRPDRRTVTTAAGRTIVRQYDYNTSALLTRLAVTSNGALVAGSAVTYDGTQKKSAQLLGVSGGVRRNDWGYDARSRLRTTALARDPGATPAADQISQADFRQSFDRPAATPVDPPSIAFAEGPAHRIDRLQRGSSTEQFAYAGGERTGDRRFTYTYDEKGRMTASTEKATAGSTATVRRILYFYAGNDRLIGRRAEYADVSATGEVGAWKLEDRTVLLAADQLPADATFVWDPISDRLVSIFKAGASENPAIDANGGLVRQIIHADDSYDDPIEVTAAASTGVIRLYPIYDEAGAGSLQVIVDENGEMVARSSLGGPYGEDETVLRSAAVDRIAVTGRKDSKGKLDGVEVKLRTTESIDAASSNSGVRLAVVDRSGAVVRESNAPAAASGAEIAWSLTGAEWDALTDPASVVVGGKTLTPQALSVAATSSLRFAGWSSNASVLPAPDWARATWSVFTSTALPVEVRESLSNLKQAIDAIGPSSSVPTTLYEVSSLGALGVVRSESPGPDQLIVASAFHAEPFQEPLTGKNYVRSRWLDPQTGTWLTPDPRGYRDSSNRYAFAGGDPVNRRDPTGAYEEDVHHYLTTFLAKAAGFDPDTAELIGWSTQELDMDDRTAMPEWHGAPRMWKGHDNMVDFHMVSQERLAELRREADFRIWFTDYERDIESRRRSIKWRAVGEYLHALEDSFSHQGGRYKRDFTRQFGTVFGHAKWGHTADHTWRRPELAIEMAQETFDNLVQLCREYHEGKRCRSLDWSQIKDKVEEFVRYNPADHGELGWELINAGGGLVKHGYIWNVLTYEGKIGVLNLKYQQRELDVRRQSFADWAKHEKQFPMSNPLYKNGHMKLHEDFDFALDREKP